MGKGENDKLGFVVLELALLCGRYLELIETIQPSLCKGRGTTKWRMGLSYTKVTIYVNIIGIGDDRNRWVSSFTWCKPALVKAVKKTKK